MADALIQLDDLQPKPKIDEVDESQLVSPIDYPRRRQVFMDKIKAGVSTIKPVENENYMLRIANVDWADTKTPTLRERADAVARNGNLTKRLTGNYELVDKTSGKVIQKTGKKTLMNVPVLTNGGTFVRNGVEMCFPSQLRLAASVFVRKSADGLPEAQVNLVPGTGSNFTLYMEPATSVFYMHMSGRKIPAYPVFKELGISDEKMQATWGKDIFNANQQQRPSAHLNKWLTNVAVKGQRFILKDIDPSSPTDHDEEAGNAPD